ncbi:MAG: PLP-dependent aminotransferase family protein [Candidatus Promineifilaceae bacterium]|nr:PLP-dependent aminotransferase family protein [Candidatus Promineifilaceae bacterium]
MNPRHLPVDIQLDRTADQPLFQQVYLQIREKILQGILIPGTRLPSSRGLAKQLDLGRITIIQAYEQLQAEGYVKTLPGSGTFVADFIAHISAGHKESSFSPELSAWGQRVMTQPTINKRGNSRLEIDFGFGRSFSHIFPYDIWRRLLARYLSTDDMMLSRYGSVAGFSPLREAVAAYLARQRGVRCTTEQVVIVSGAQQALDILARLLLNPGDEVLVETPGYYDAYTLFETHGAVLVALSVDEYGLPVEKLPPLCCARIAFVTPSHQFPRGGMLSLQRRLALLGWAEENHVWIIEDDYDSELRYDGRPLSALQGLDTTGHVIYLGNFSKVLFPGLRLGYIVLPKPLIEPFVRAKGLTDRGAPTLTQAAVADFIAEGHFERHLRHLRKAYKERREVLVAALETYLSGRVHYSSVAAGLHVMLYLNPTCSEKEIVKQAASIGVGIYPGAPYHHEQPAPPSILLGYTGLDTAEIHEGVKRLATIIPE